MWLGMERCQQGGNIPSATALPAEKAGRTTRAAAALGQVHLLCSLAALERMDSGPTPSQAGSAYTCPVGVQPFN